MPPDAVLLNEDRLHARMAELQLDAVVATTPENVTYMSGFWALPQWIRRGPQAYVVWPAPGRAEAEIVTSTATLDLVADQDVWIKHVRRYGAFHIDRHHDVAKDPVGRRQLELTEEPEHTDALTALVAALTDADLARGRIGIDEIGLMPGQFETLRERLPDAILLPAATLFRHVREVKTQEEIARRPGSRRSPNARSRPHSASPTRAQANSTLPVPSIPGPLRTMHFRCWAASASAKEAH